MFSQLMKELVSTNNYKSSQGRVARRMTFIGLSLIFIWGGFSLYNAHYFAPDQDRKQVVATENATDSTAVETTDESTAAETKTDVETTAAEPKTEVVNQTDYASAIAGLLVAVLGVWVSFRVINFPSFADFLVSVEAEMSKVSWPSKRDLYANTRVVLIFMALFTALIFVYDSIFKTVFSLIS